MRDFNSIKGWRNSVSSMAIGAAFGVAFMVSNPALAAETTSTLTGHVNGASKGAKVVLTNADNGQKYIATVREDGSYVIVGAQPGNYKVKAGEGAAQEVVLTVGETAVQDLDATSSTVVVRGRRKDVRTSEISTSVSQQQIANLPQNDRNFLNFAALAPGVSVSSGNKQFMGGGVSADQVNVYIDGQSQKSQVYHGGVSGQAFSKGNPFPQLAVKEFKVSTQNFKAEYEQAGSAIITAVTKSGTNEFHGDVFYDYTDKNMRNQPYYLRGQPKTPGSRKQYGIDFGGPIVKDKLFYYFAMEGTDLVQPDKTVTFKSQVPTSISSLYNGTFPEPFKQKLYFGKLSYIMNDADTLNLSYFRRTESDVTDYGGVEAREHGRNLESFAEQAMLEHIHRGDNFTNEFTVSYVNNHNGTPRVGTGSEIILTEGSDPNGRLGVYGGNSFMQDGGKKATVIKDVATFTGIDWHGSHVVKLGGKIDSSELSRTEDSFSNGAYFWNITSATPSFVSTSSSMPYIVKINTMSNVASTNQDTQIGIFAQDDWTIDNHWTINAGIRWDYETNMNNKKFVTPTKIAAALRSYAGWKAAGINPEDYISTGTNRKSFTGAFQPRLGVSYDVNGDRDFVVFAGAGRYYDRTVYLASQIESIKALYSNVVTLNFVKDANDPHIVNRDPNYFVWDSKYLNPDEARKLAQGIGGEVWLLNNDTKVPYSDQFNIGIRKKFGDINTSISLSHVDSHNIFQYVRGNRMPDGTFSPLGDKYVIDNFPTAGILPGYSGKLNIGANGGKARYNAIFLTVDKPMGESNYGYNVAITLADAKQLGSELASDEFFAGPRQDVFGWTYTPGVDKFRMVATGIMKGPWSTTLSAALTLASGTPFGSIDGRGPNPPNACCIANLSGVYFPDTNLAYQNLDLRVAKDFTLPNGNVITLDGQVYNVFDHVNRTWSSWGGGANWGGGASLKPDDNSINGNARTYKVGLKYKW